MLTAVAVGGAVTVGGAGALRSVPLSAQALSAVATGGHPAVAGLLGVGTAGLAGAVVAMAWNLHVRQIRLAEQQARRQLMAAADTGVTQQAIAHPAVVNGGAARADRSGRAGGTGRADNAGLANGPGPASGAGAASGPGPVGGTGAASGTGPANGVRHADTNGAAARAAARLTIDGPDTVVTGEQARFSVPSMPSRRVVSWAAGGGSLAQAPDPARPEDLLLIADRPGELMVTVWVREGLTERRATKPVTAVPDTEVTPSFTLRPFLGAWGLVVVAVLVIGFAGALAALGVLSPGDFIALAAPLAALLAVTAVACGAADQTGRRAPEAGGPASRPG